MDNVSSRGRRFLSQNRSCHVWDTALWIVSPGANNNFSKYTGHCHCSLLPSASIWSYLIAKATTHFEYVPQRHQLELSCRLSSYWLTYTVPAGAMQGVWGEKQSHPAVHSVCYNTDLPDKNAHWYKSWHDYFRGNQLLLYLIWGLNQRRWYVRGSVNLAKKSIAKDIIRNTMFLQFNIVEIRSLYHPLQGPGNIMEQSVGKLQELAGGEDH